MNKSIFKDALKESFRQALKPLTVSEGRKSSGAVVKKASKADGELSISKWLRGVRYGRWEGARKEQDAHESAMKQMAENVGSSGGYLVPPQIMNQIIELLRAQAVLRRMNPMVIGNVQSNTVEIPKQTAASTAYWIGENQEKQESELEFGMLELVLKELACLVKSSNVLIQDSTPAADKIIKQDMATSIALAEDSAYILGTGGVMPLGIYNWPGIPTTTLTAAVTFNNLLNAQYTIEAANAEYTGWLMHPRSKNTLRQIVDLNGRYVWDDGLSGRIGSVQNEVPAGPTLFGLPVFCTTQIPTNLTFGGITNASFIILGDWREFVIADKGGMTLDVSTEAGTAFVYNQTWFRAVKRTACGVRQPSAFHIINGVV